MFQQYLLRTFQLAFLAPLCMISFGFAAQDPQAVEERLVVLQNTIGTAKADKDRFAASEEMAELLIKAFQHDDTWTYPFGKCSKMGSLSAPDGAFRLFNWNVPRSDGTYAYVALILFPDKAYHRMDGTGSATEADEKKVLRSTQWHGALYYHMEATKSKDGTWYTLLGWDGHNALSNKKIIEILWFNDNREPMLGRPVLRHGKELRSRRVFEYAKSAQMTLSYLPVKGAIVYDVLVPQPGATKGNYTAYVSGEEHHGYFLKGGEWVHEENVDMTRPKSEEGKAQFNFPARPDLNKKRDATTPPQQR